MLKLAILLIGPDAFRSQWHVLALAGAALMAIAAAVAAGLSEALTSGLYLAIGLALAGSGLVTLLAGLRGAARAGSPGGAHLARGAAGLALGICLLASQLLPGWAVALPMALALGLVGLNRFAAAFVLKVPGWRLAACYGAAELAMAVLMLAGWPLPTARMAPLGAALFLGVSGWILLRIGLLLRTLEDETAILMLPVFARRGWYDHAPVLVGRAGAVPQRHAAPMTVRIWTPGGAISDPVNPLPVITHYIAAFDRDGTAWTGHGSLELLPDVYLSHYPARSMGNAGHGSLLDMLGTGRERDVEGRLMPSYPEDAASWRPAEISIRIHTYSERRLRAFWAGYRQDSTYNLTNRNCSTLVVAALDAALEGALATPAPWRRLLGLLLDPDIWVAALVRSRAATMSWTPGLLLDYARLLRRLVDRPRVTWARRLRLAAARPVRR